MTVATPLEQRYTVNANGCHIFEGARQGRGYGSVSIAGVTYLVHRIVWEQANGPIPDGMTVDHLCRNKACMNVEHMELVSRAENSRRAALRPSHCPKGHPYTPTNTRVKVRPNGQVNRTCRVCDAERSRRYRREVAR